MVRCGFSGVCPYVVCAVATMLCSPKKGGDTEHDVRKLKFSRVPGSFAVCRLTGERSPVPDWALHGPFFSVTRHRGRALDCLPYHSGSDRSPSRADWACLKLKVHFRSPKPDSYVVRPAALRACDSHLCHLHFRHGLRSGQARVGEKAMPCRRRGTSWRNVWVGRSWPRLRRQAASLASLLIWSRTFPSRHSAPNFRRTLFHLDRRR